MLLYFRSLSLLIPFRYIQLLLWLLLFYFSSSLASQQLVSSFKSLKSDLSSKRVPIAKSSTYNHIIRANTIANNNNNNYNYNNANTKITRSHSAAAADATTEQEWTIRSTIRILIR